MPKEISTPKMVGELIEVLSKYPSAAPLNVFITQTYDDGGTAAAESNCILIEEWGEEIGIIFADGYKL